ncbi:hypothetical protein ACJJTC_009777 [Scirpophaga incertulas]
MRLCLVLLLLLVPHSGFCKYDNRSHQRNTKSHSSIEYITKHRHRITIPVIIHFDKSLTDRLAKIYRTKTRKKLKEISKTILKDVEHHFRHASLNQSIHFAIQDTRFLRRSTVKMDENASAYLKKYCAWQGDRKKAARRWWFSILLTALDLYYVNGRGHKIRNSTGRSYMGGVCTLTKSCSLLEWNPKNIGYLLTHEIGHSLGMAHDGPPHNTCRTQLNIMSNKYHPHHLPKTWSRCNKQDLQRFLSSRNSWCIRKRHL